MRSKGTTRSAYATKRRFKYSDEHEAWQRAAKSGTSEEKLNELAAAHDRRVRAIRHEARR